MCFCLLHNCRAGSCWLHTLAKAMQCILPAESCFAIVEGNGTDLGSKDPLRQWVGTIYFVTMQVCSCCLASASCSTAQCYSPLCIGICCCMGSCRLHLWLIRSSLRLDAVCFIGEALTIATALHARPALRSPRHVLWTTLPSVTSLIIFYVPMQVTTVGQGDIVPNTPIEELFSCFTMIMGVILFGFAISSSQ